MGNSIGLATLPELAISGLMQTYCRHLQFEPGNLLRKKGQHYREMYLITDGSVEVDFENGGATTVVSGSGSPIGEMGFLRGCAATATVTARTTIQALVIDDQTLARLDNEEHNLAAGLLRHLARTAEERTSFNLTFNPSLNASRGGNGIDVYLCRNHDMLESAKRLRYEVYCRELGRNSPYADHEKQTISDDLDSFGYTFIAVRAGEVIGTLRSNLSVEGPLGALEEVYGMKESNHHPQATGICTKFIVRKAKRGTPTSAKLIAAMTRFGIENGIKECYIDCIPALLPYYMALGFTITGPIFFHRENGPSYPMKLDLMRHGEALCKERGVRDDLKLYVKAQAIRLVQGKSSAVPRSRDGRP